MRTHSSTRAALAALLCAAGLFVLDTSPATAQVTASSGSRVRITSPSLGLSAVTGTVREATDDSLLVQFNNPRRSVRIGRGDITAMDVSTERHRRTLRGLGTGALAGAGAGAVLGLASGDDPPEMWFSLTAPEKAVALGVLLGATGAVVGVIAGALTQTDVWTPASTGSPPPVNVSLAPFTSERGTGFRVGVSLALR